VIPPGGEGNITLTFNTNGYAGKTMTKTTLVKTNDPENPDLTLVISGQVKNSESE
jgi:hypothetical protein